MKEINRNLVLQSLSKNLCNLSNLWITILSSRSYFRLKVAAIDESEHSVPLAIVPIAVGSVAPPQSVDEALVTPAETASGFIHLAWKSAMMKFEPPWCRPVAAA